MASENVRLMIHTSVPHTEAPVPAAAPVKTAARRGIRLDMGNRLLRNSCIACALLLGILTVGTIRAPWAEGMTDHIRQALTMKIDLDKTPGGLTFVQRMMPDSALVFFNLNAASELTQPVRGEATHLYSPTQPWLMFAAESGADVCAAKDGVVSAVSALSGGTYGVLIDHGEGTETVTACLSNVCVKNGEPVKRGDVIGTANGDVYFELRKGGESADPTAQMGL